MSDEKFTPEELEICSTFLNDVFSPMLNRENTLGRSFMIFCIDEDEDNVRVGKLVIHQPDQEAILLASRATPDEDKTGSAAAKHVQKLTAATIAMQTFAGTMEKSSDDAINRAVMMKQMTDMFAEE